MNYRILIARSGYYYGQRYSYGRWSRVTGFYRTRQGVRNAIRRGRARVVEYIY